MDLAKGAIPSKFAWRTSPRKQPPPSARIFPVLKKRKQLEGALKETVGKDSSISVASYANTPEGSLTSEADDTVSVEVELLNQKIHVIH